MGCFEKLKNTFSNLNIFGNRKIRKNNKQNDYIKI